MNGTLLLTVCAVSPDRKRVKTSHHELKESRQEVFEKRLVRGLGGVGAILEGTGYTESENSSI